MKLQLADYVSLAALMMAWISIVLWFNDFYLLAIGVNILAFGLDVVDGMVARRQGLKTTHGPLLDTFVDAVIYLVFGGLVALAIVPHFYFGVALGGLVLACGVLRLVRLNVEGFGKTQTNKTYYRGFTTVHTWLILVVGYVILWLFPSVWLAWLLTVLVIASCVMMLSDYKYFKRAGGWYLALMCLLLGLLCLSFYGLK